MINTYGNKTVLQKTCASCNRLDHFINECPFINAHFQKKNIISKHKTDAFNERQKFYRKKNKGHHAKKMMKFIQEKAKSYEILVFDYFSPSNGNNYFIK